MPRVHCPFPTPIIRWSKPDPALARYVSPSATTAALPTSASVEAWMPPNANQGFLNTCGPVSVHEIVQCVQKRSGQPVVAPSRLFQNWTTHLLTGTPPADGTDCTHLMQAIRQYGWVPEWMCQYDLAKVGVAPPTRCYEVAAGFAGVIPQQVAGDAGSVKAAIAAGNPVLMAFNLHESFYQTPVWRTGVVPDPLPSEPIEGGHIWEAIAYDEGGFPYPNGQRRINGPAYKCRNHWRLDYSDGTHGWWGDNNCGYISEKFLLTEAGDFWVLPSTPAYPMPANGARVYATLPVSVPSHSLTAVPEYDSIRHDHGGYFAGENPTRLTVPKGFGGQYTVGANIYWTPNMIAGGSRFIGLRANGDDTQIFGGSFVQPSGDGYCLQEVNSSAVLGAGDYVEVVLKNASGMIMQGLALPMYSMEFFMTLVK